MPRSPRYAAGRTRALGLPTRVDRRLTGASAALLRTAPGPPLVVDLGYGLAGLRPLVVRALNVLRQYDGCPRR